MRRRAEKLRALGLSLEHLESRQLLAVTPQLLADINPTFSSDPRQFAELNDRLYFFATSGSSQSALWSSDGTEAGTQLEVDLDAQGVTIGDGPLVESGGLLYFVASDTPHGQELWRTDGTAAGTMLIKDIVPGNQNSVSPYSSMVDLDGTLYFMAPQSLASRIKLWKSDGTAEGTVPVTDPGNSPDLSGSLAVVGNSLFFPANSGGLGYELWTSDGSAEGTHLVEDIYPGSSSSNPRNLVTLNGAAYFMASSGPDSSGLWTSDGTAEGTQLVQQLETADLSATRLTAVGDQLFFVTSEAELNLKLWSSNGSSAGTNMIQEIPLAATTSNYVLNNVGGTLLFWYTIDQQSSLWVSDGTSEGTQKIRDFDEGEVIGYTPHAVFQGELYFQISDAQNATSRILWKSDGTSSGTTAIYAGTAANPFQVSRLFAVGNQLFMAAQADGLGVELWTTDGSSAGTHLVKDIPTIYGESSNPSNFIRAGSHIYFMVRNQYGRPQLWASDGSPGNATQITPTEIGLRDLTPVGDLLYFTATDDQGHLFLAVTDGTAAGTHRLYTNLPGDVEQFANFANVDGQLFFTLRESGQWYVGRSDGNSIEVITAIDAIPRHYFTNNPNSVTLQAAAGGLFYFAAANGQEVRLWRSDGTASGTYGIEGFTPSIDPRLPTGLYRVGDSLLFTGLDSQHGNTLGIYKTDGTPEGTLRISDALPANIRTPRNLIVSGDLLYFTVSVIPGSTNDLWVTDGTLEGTHFVTAFPLFSSVSLIDLSGTLYAYGLPDNTHGEGLWKLEGDSFTFITSPNVYPYYSGQLDIAVFDNIIYFLGSPLITRSDGTAAGSFTVGWTNIRQDPADITVLDNKLFLSNYTSAGYEPAYLDMTTQVVGQQLFYNNSKFDDHDPAANDLDSAAIATDKTAYLPGTGLSSFDNVSSYSRGINGVMLDFTGAVGNLSAADFSFRVGTTADPNDWATAPTPLEVVQKKTNVDGQLVDRIDITWADGAIVNTWLEVTVLPNAATGLTEPYVFYYGSRVGDTGQNSLQRVALTNALDEILVRASTSANVAITNSLDFNRDGLINAADEMIARANTGALRMLEVSRVVVTPQAATPTPIGLTLFSADSKGEALPAAIPWVATSPADSVSVANRGNDNRLAFAAASVWAQPLEQGSSTAEVDVEDELLETLLDGRFALRR